MVYKCVKCKKEITDHITKHICIDCWDELYNQFSSPDVVGDKCDKCELNSKENIPCQFTNDNICKGKISGIIYDWWDWHMVPRCSEALEKSDIDMLERLIIDCNQ